MSEKPISPLRQRMIDDMTARRVKEKVQKDYVRHVRTFAAFLGRSPDTATSEDLRRFQVHPAQQQIGVATINAAIAALRFFFNVTLERPDLVRHLTTVGGSEIDGGGALADPALLVRNGENARPRTGFGLAIERMDRVHGLWFSLAISELGWQTGQLKTKGATGSRRKAGSGSRGAGQAEPEFKPPALPEKLVAAVGAGSILSFVDNLGSSQNLPEILR